MIIKRVGGKSKIASWIISHFNKCDIFVDCFGGSGAVLNEYKSQQHNCRYIFNDFDKKIFTFFKVIQQFPHEFSHLINLTPYSRCIFDNAHSIFKNEQFQELDLIDQALCFLIVNRQSFGSKMEKDWSITRDGEINYQTWNKLPSYVIKTFKLWKEVYLENLDYAILIDKWDSPQTLFYLDPPYEGVEKDYYEINEKDGFDHIKMFNKLTAIQGKFYVSYYGAFEEKESSLIGKYQDFGCKIYRKKVTKHLSLKSKAQAIELLITNEKSINKKLSSYD